MVIVSRGGRGIERWLTAGEVPLSRRAVCVRATTEAIVMDQRSPRAYASRNFTDTGTTRS